MLYGFELYSRWVPLTVCDGRWGVIVDWLYYRSRHVFVSKYSDVSTKDYKIYDEPLVSSHPLLSGQYPEGGYIMEIQLYLDTAIFETGCHKSARNNPERYCGWFWGHCSSKKFERMAWKTTDIPLRVLKLRNATKVGSIAIVSGTVYWSYPILPFVIVACTFFVTTFLKIAVYTVCSLGRKF